MNNSFLQGGKHYELLINWNKRLNKEIPFLLSHLEQIHPKIKTILEVGCGPGRHMEILSNKGFQLTGVDIETTMIEEARKRVPNAELIVNDFLDHNLLIDREFDAIISIGNSIGLIARTSNYELIIQQLTRLLRKENGLLIFQLLNTEKERSGWSKPRSIIQNEREYVFLRGFRTSESHIHPEILTLTRLRDSPEWEIHSTGQSAIPRITSRTMTQILTQYGYQNIQIHGSYQNQDFFNPEESVDMIFIATT